MDSTAYTYRPELKSSTLYFEPRRVVDAIVKHHEPAVYVGPLPEFKQVTAENINELLPYLDLETGRTTDFTYGGIYMWVNYFHYEFAILEDTLFIKGRLEDDRTQVAFSLPIGMMPIERAVAVLKRWCEKHDMELQFSAIPEHAIESFEKAGAKVITELTDWADYLYDAGQLAWLKGKKMAKKRNHVNRFLAEYPDYQFEPMSLENVEEAMQFMDIYDLEGDDNSSARAERLLTRRLISHFANYPDRMEGAILKVNGEVCAITIGDVKDDTLYVHIEKATRNVAGSYEAINVLFLRYIMEKYPSVEFVNREDDAGDEGLRKAKQSYHPMRLLRKYDIKF